MSATSDAFDAARNGADLGALALALQRQDTGAAVAAVDWQALLGALMLARDPQEALGLVEQAKAGFRALVAQSQASSLTADELVTAVGVNLAQARMLATRAEGLAKVGASADRIARVFSEQARHLVAQRVAAITERPTPVARPFYAIDAVETRLGDAFSRGLGDAIAAAREAIDVDALAAAVEARDLRAVMAELPLEELAGGVRGLARDLRSAYFAGATAGYEHLGGNSDLLDAKAADAWASGRAAELEAWIRGTAEASAREVLGSLEAFGTDAAGVASLIRNRIGLTGRNAGAAAQRYADTLGAGASQAEASAASGGYARDLETARLASFGSEQSYSAANVGQRAGWRQAQRDGLVRNAARYWLDREDGRVCPRCGAMGGQRRSLDEPFYSDPARGGDGKWYMDPGDPHLECRCAALVVALAPDAPLAEAA